MKNEKRLLSGFDGKCLPRLLAILIMCPMVSQAALSDAPIQLSMTHSLLLAGAFLLLVAGVFYFLQRRNQSTSHELLDITAELNTARTRLTQTTKDLEYAQQDLRVTQTHYQSILFDASVGLFHIAPNGQCTYVNQAMQQLSGLYQKKAEQQGIASAVHPEDRPRFNQAWQAFVDGKEAFCLDFRFQFKRGNKENTVHVSCQANKKLNDRKEVESYIGWVTDISSFYKQQLQEQAQTARYDYFINETLESYFRLAPEHPIPLTGNSAKIAETIMETMSLLDCNETFAAAYGSRQADLLGKKISELNGGCGSLKHRQDLIRFVEDGYTATNVESILQDANGARLNLLNNIVGIVEDNQLVAIWGAQRNISQQKNETAEKDQQVRFMQRILDALPATVHVKDTRCRYLYTSKKITERTGIPAAGWIGKTIHEVMPEAARDHDQPAIEAMKSGKLICSERPYEASDSSGWQETLQMPLVSEDGLVEGVVGLSLEITDRKNKESEAAAKYEALEENLKQTRDNLSRVQNDYTQTADFLSDTLEQLKLAETHEMTRIHELQQQLTEREQTEEALRRSEQELLNRQHQLEEQLSKQLSELKAETEKRQKWDKLLSIKEEALLETEAYAEKLARQTAETEDFLQGTQAQLIRLTAEYEQEAEQEHTAQAALSEALEKARLQLEQNDKKWQETQDTSEKGYKAQLDKEHHARRTAEKQLTRTENLLQQVQEDTRQLTEHHSKELEEEVTERKTAAEKLMQSMEELDALRQQFHLRLDEETKAMKQELARKQIHEKTFRQNEKDLNERIRDLENMLSLKSQEFTEQIQVRENVEVQKQQLEQKLELMKQRQQELVSRETQKLELHVAEVRLKEIKLRKATTDVLREKEALEELLQTRNDELEKRNQKQQETEAELKAAEAQLQKLSEDTDALISAEKEALQKQLTDAQQQSDALQIQIETLRKGKQELQQILEHRDTDLERVQSEFCTCKAKIKQLTEDHEATLAQKTELLRTEMEHMHRTEAEFHKQLQEFSKHSKKQQEHIDTLTAQLTNETAQRKQASQELQSLKITSESERENTETLVREQIKTLTAQIAALEAHEEQLKHELEKSRSGIAQKDERLAVLKTEHEEAEKRINTIENELAGMRQEQQVELHKSLAEVKAVSLLNSDLVDELNEAVQTALNPVVKSTIFMEKSDNLSNEQRQNMVKASLSCRRLMDMMNYRSELTHIADGADQLEMNCCDLHEVMADIDRQFSHRAEAKKLFFAVSFAQYQQERNVPKQVETDECKVRKVLSILLGYAVEKTQHGRFGLHTTRKSSSEGRVKIAFELAYTGQEPNDALLSSIFGNDKDCNEIVDVQYGLSLARRYIEMLDGEYTLEYRSSGITALTLQLPFKEIAANAKEDENNEKKAGAA
jgi:PAS domain S-box-containing protein